MAALDTWFWPKAPSLQGDCFLNRAASPLTGTHRVACSGRAETFGESSRITRHGAPNDGGDDERKDHGIPDIGIRQPGCSTGAVGERDPVWALEGSIDHE